MLLKWYTFIKPNVMLDALCGMDPEVVGFESTESSDKNLTMEYTSDVERDCLCCSLKSRSLLHVHDSSSQGSTVESINGRSNVCDAVYVLCENTSCGKKQFYKCAMLLLDQVKSTVPESTWSLHPWVREMMPFFLSSEYPTTNISVTNCISCVTAAHLPKDMKTTLTNIKIPSNLPVCAYADVEGDEEYADSADIIATKRSWCKAIAECIQKLEKPLESPTDIMKYLSGYQRQPHFQPPRYHSFLKNKEAGNEFEGALYFPTHRFLLCSYADNGKLYVDVHGLAYSSMDNNPAIPHMVLSSADATALNNHYETSRNKNPTSSQVILEQQV